MDQPDIRGFEPHDTDSSSIHYDFVDGGKSI